MEKKGALHRKKKRKRERKKSPATGQSPPGWERKKRSSTYLKNWAHPRSQRARTPEEKRTAKKAVCFPPSKKNPRSFLHNRGKVPSAGDEKKNKRCLNLFHWREGRKGKSGQTVIQVGTGI